MAKEAEKEHKARVAHEKEVMMEANKEKMR